MAKRDINEILKTMTYEDACRVLGVDFGADRALVKEAYADLVKFHHPDVGGKADNFKRITRAYELAQDPSNYKPGQRYTAQGYQYKEPRKEQRYQDPPRPEPSPSTGQPPKWRRRGKRFVIFTGILLAMALLKLIYQTLETFSFPLGIEFAIQRGIMGMFPLLTWLLVPVVFWRLYKSSIPWYLAGLGGFGAAYLAGRLLLALG